MRDSEPQTVARSRAAKDYLKIKAAFRELCGLCGGYDAAAASTRVNKTTLHRYGSISPENMTWFAPADVILDLETAVEVPTVSTSMASLLDCVLVPQIMNDQGSPIHKPAGEAKQTATALCGQAIAAMNSDSSADISKTVQQAIKSLVEVDRSTGEGEK